MMPPINPGRERPRTDTCERRMTGWARRGGAVLAALAVVLAGAACSEGPGAPAAGTSTTLGSSSASPTSETAGTSGASGAATSSPPEGSGATASGLTATVLPPIVVSGATKTSAACRQIYPLVTEAVTAWNNANTASSAGTAGTAAVGKAAEAMTKAATAIPPIATESGDSRLVQLTDVVAARLKAVAADYGANKDVDGSALTKTQTDLWSYCQTAR